LRIFSSPLSELVFSNKQKFEPDFFGRLEWVQFTKRNVTLEALRFFKWFCKQLPKDNGEELKRKKRTSTPIKRMEKREIFCFNCLY